MLTLEEVKDWIKSQDTELSGCIAVGSINGNSEKFVGVYPLRPSGNTQRICIGGSAQTKYQSRSVSVLLHWTDSPVTAEKKAAELYGRFYGLSDTVMGESRVVSADPGPEPISVGKDDRGICEYVIRVKMIYERND